MAFALPQEPVGVGDSWTAETELAIAQVPSGGTPLRPKTKLTVKEIHASGPDTTVLIALETEFPGDPVKVMQDRQVLTLKMSGYLTGEQLFSVSRGAVIRSTRTGTIGIHITGAILGPDGTNTTAKQRISLQLQEAK
jgi:hypothetical protein